MPRNKTEQKNISSYSGQPPRNICPAILSARGKAGPHSPTFNEGGTPHEPFGIDSRGNLQDDATAGRRSTAEAGLPFAEAYAVYICRYCSTLYASVVHDPTK